MLARTDNPWYFRSSEVECFSVKNGAVQLAAAIPGAALARITSKAESEILHHTDLARTLNDFRKPFKQKLSR